MRRTHRASAVLVVVVASCSTGGEPQLDGGGKPTRFVIDFAVLDLRWPEP